MADTYSSRMRFIIPEIGANNNTWGTDLNTNFDLIDYSFAGRLPITLSNVDYTLTANDGASDEARACSLILSGTLSANVNVILPSTAGSKVYVIINNTSGAFTVTFKTAGGAGVVVPQDGKAYLFFRDSDGSGVKAVRGVQGSFLNEAQSYSAAQACPFVTLTDGASIALDASLGNSFYVQLGGNRTLSNPTNPRDGQVIDVFVQQDGTGSRTLAYGGKYEWPGNVAPTLTTTANRIDWLVFKYRSATDRWYGSSVLNYTPT